MIEPIKPSTTTKKGGEKVLPPKIVILGVGNLLLSDEGIGVHVATELMKMSLPPEVSVVEGGTDGFRLLNIITEVERLIVIDAVKGDAAPGSIYRFDIDEVRNCPSGFKTSVHQIGILEVLDLSALIGKTPHTTVIGIEPKSLEMGMELSPEIKAKVPRMIELVMDELKIETKHHPSPY
jgi:hydrogenase maturation protease